MAKTVIEFKKDAKKRYMALVTPQWAEVLHCLIQNLPLQQKYANHPLRGEWQ